MPFHHHITSGHWVTFSSGGMNYWTNVERPHKQTTTSPMTRGHSVGVTRSQQQYLNYTVIGLDSAENLTQTESHAQLTLIQGQDIGYNLIHVQVTLLNNIEQEQPEESQ